MAREDFDHASTLRARAQPLESLQEQDEASGMEDDDSERWGIQDAPRKGSEHFDESDYDSGQDPIERFFVVTKWQRKLTKLQTNLLESPAASKLNGTLNDINGTVTRVRRNSGGVAAKLTQEAYSTLKKGSNLAQKQLGSTLRDSQRVFQQQSEAQVKAVKENLEKVIAKSRMKKVRQLRHQICFLCSMANVVVMAFWLGRFPHTFYWWYTANCLWLIGCRAVWYKWHNCHYFLLDLCYWANAALLAYLWIFYDNEWIFQGILGSGGVLMVSVPLFRNSFVPHSLDRITSFQVHLMPMVMIWVLRWPSDKDAAAWPWKIPEASVISYKPAIVMYLCWATAYYTLQWVVCREHIERTGCETLFKHMAQDMGFEKKLPRSIQKYTRALFMAGHFLLFMVGTPVVHLSYWVHTVAMCIVILWGFKNGAAFYMTYFWRVYDEQISAFERQMAQAEKDVQEMQSRQNEIDHAYQDRRGCDDHLPKDVDNQSPHTSEKQSTTGSQSPESRGEDDDHADVDD